MKDNLNDFEENYEVQTTPQGRIVIAILLGIVVFQIGSFILNNFLKTERRNLVGVVTKGEISFSLWSVL